MAFYLITYFYLIGAGVFGLLVGSFLNVVIYRLPIMLSREWEKQCCEYLKQVAPIRSEVFNLLLPRSHCPKCNVQISWWQNIPVFSYIILRGKCSSCKSAISWRYPAIELLSSLLSVVVVLKFGTGLAALSVLILTWMLIVAVFIDFDHQLLPDNITFSLLWFGLLLNAYGVFITPRDAIIGAAFGYLLLWSIAYIFKLIRKVEGMGEGDFILLAAFGAWVGWQKIPLILFASALMGGIIGVAMIILKKDKLNTPIAFGPYLAIAGWLDIILCLK